MRALFLIAVSALVLVGCEARDNGQAGAPGVANPPAAASPSPQPAAAAPQSPAPPPIAAGPIKLVCSIRFCTNVYYPDRCNDTTRRYTVDVEGGTITLPDGSSSPIQKTDGVISWTDIYEYLGAPVGPTQFSLDRSTLELHAETPGTTRGQCAKDQPQL